MKRSSPPKAFSLFEIVLVIFLTSMILLAVSQLLSKTLGSLRFLQEKSQTSESATLGCERLASELAEAVKIPTPIPPEEVTFEKINPNLEQVLGIDPIDPPAPAPPIDPTTWPRTYPSSSHLKISYKVDANSNLQRSADGIAQTVATSVNSFIVKPYDKNSLGSFTVRLSIQEQRRVVTYETVVTVPALQEYYSP